MKNILFNILFCKVLDLSNNNIRELPPSLGYIESLQVVSIQLFVTPSPSQHLKIDGNPLKTIRQTLLVGPTADLKTYLRSRGPPLASSDAKIDPAAEQLIYRIR